jgi:hypothetical protein
MENIRKALNKTSQVMQKPAQAGLTEKLIDNIINSPDNQMAETIVSSIFDETKNKFLKKIHNDSTGIVRKMDGPDACFEELFGSLCGHSKFEKLFGSLWFGSLCGHSKGEDTISVLIEKLKENNLLFPSKETGVDYIKAGVKSGIHKKGFTYFFVYLDEDGNLFLAGVGVNSYGFVRMDVFDLTSGFEWSAGRGHRFVVSATKILDTQG